MNVRIETKGCVAILTNEDTGERMKDVIGYSITQKGGERPKLTVEYFCKEIKFIGEDVVFNVK